MTVGCVSVHCIWTSQIEGIMPVMVGLRVPETNPTNQGLEHRGRPTLSDTYQR